MAASEQNETREQWRQRFQKRLQTAFSKFQQQKQLTATERTHFRDFRRYLAENEGFRTEMTKLNQFEFEVVAIASTRAQLEHDRLYFTAEEVSRTFEFGIRIERREEVRSMIFGASTYSDVKAAYRDAGSSVETNRIQDMMGRAKQTLTRTAAVELCSRLAAELETGPWSGRRHAHYGFQAQNPTERTPPPLSPDAFELLSIIHAAGGKVPECFLRTALGYNSQGELAPVEVPAMAVLTDKKRRDAALHELLESRHLLASEIAGSMLWTVHPAKAAQLQITDTWKLAALQAVSRAFPRHPSLSFSDLGLPMIPLLSTVLSYLPEVALGDELPAAIADVCISASYFGQMPWKEYMLQVAKKFELTDQGAARRLNLRSRMVRRLAGEEVDLQDTPPPEAPLSCRENAEFGEQVVFEMKLLVDRETSTEKVQQCLHKFRPLDHDQVSFQERCVLVEGQDVLARALRNAGRFADADALQKRIATYVSAEWKGLISPEVLANQAETLCELGDPGAAFRKLEGGVRCHLIGSRIELALAHVWLMKALWEYMTHQRLDHEALREAEDLYARYAEVWQLRRTTGLTSTDKENYYLACAGIAIIQHTSTFNFGDSDVLMLKPKLVKARESWKIAREAALQCSLADFAVMVTLYSESEIAYRLRLSDADGLNESARQMFHRTGRSYYFIAQGTLWLDILCKILSDGKRVE